MLAITYPLDLEFKVLTLANDFIAQNSKGETIAYARQKLLKLKTEVEIFTDDSQSTKVYTLKANSWMDFSTSYEFINASGVVVGRIVRKGLVSLWKAHYEIMNGDGKVIFTIREDNPWLKVLDQLIPEIVTGYLFNPAYVLTRGDGSLTAKLTKRASLMQRRFSMNLLSETSPQEEELIFLGFTMVALLERRRG